MPITRETQVPLNIYIFHYVLLFHYFCSEICTKFCSRSISFLARYNKSLYQIWCFCPLCKYIFTKPLYHNICSYISYGNNKFVSYQSFDIVMSPHEFQIDDKLVQSFPFFDVLMSPLQFQMDDEVNQVMLLC